VTLLRDRSLKFGCYGADMATRPWPANATIRIAVRGLTAKDVNWANVFWCQAGVATIPTVAQMNTYATNFLGAFNTHLWALLGKDATSEEASANWYYSPDVEVAGSHAASTAGGSANDTEVDSLSCVISWAFASTWRGGKPRTYLASLPTEAFADSNTLDSTFVSNVLSGAGAFLTAVNALSGPAGGTNTLIVQSFFSGNAPRASAATYAISSAAVHPRISSMRRRLGREVT
jgi:hypothetical protein